MNNLIVILVIIRARARNNTNTTSSNQITQQTFQRTSLINRKPYAIELELL